MKPISLNPVQTPEGTKLTTGTEVSTAGVILETPCSLSRIEFVFCDGCGTALPTTAAACTRCNSVEPEQPSCVTVEHQALLCIRCGSEVNQIANFCEGCGHQIRPSTSTNGPHFMNVAASAASDVNYNDFGFCPFCKAVNLIAVRRCIKCNAEATITPIQGSYFRSLEFWALLVIGIVGVFTVAITLLSAGRIVYMVIRRSREEQRARWLIRQEATVLFANLKEEQIAKANQQLRDGMFEFNCGHWKEAHELFVESMVFAVTTAEQPLGAALTAYNLGDRRNAVEYADKLDGYRLAEVKELKARCYLQVKHLEWPEIAFLAEVCPDLSLSLKQHVAHVVLHWWLKAPSIQKQIEELLLVVGREQLRVIEYEEALAYYRVLQGRLDEALGVCVSIPDADLTEGLLAVYCQILRTRNEHSSRTFDLFSRLWVARPENVENSLYLANLSLERRDIGFAEAVIRKSLELNAADIRVRYHLAVVLRMSGRIQECLAELQQLLRVPESDSYRSHDDVRLLMAKCLMESNVDDAAVRQLQGMVRTSAVLDLLYDLGLKYSAADKQEKARECWADIYGIDVRYKDVAMRINA